MPDSWPWMGDFRVGDVLIQLVLPGVDLGSFVLPWFFVNYSG
jgi:uncharacterized protein YbbC (DUF1343 family)